MVKNYDYLQSHTEEKVLSYLEKSQYKLTPGVIIAMYQVNC